MSSSVYAICEFGVLIIVGLHILGNCLIKHGLQFIYNKNQNNTIVSGETFYKLSINTAFAVINDPVSDSGATAHAWNHLSHFTKFVPSDDNGPQIRLANGIKVQSAGIRDIGLLKRVLYVPEIAHCLISARVLSKNGYEMTTGRGARVTKIGDPTSTLLQSNSRSGLYVSD